MAAEVPAENVDELTTWTTAPTVDFARALDGQTGELGGFRARGRRVFLTLAGLEPEWVTLSEVVEYYKAKCKGGCREYAACRELHPSPADPEKNVHFHIYLCSKDEFDTRSWAYFAMVKGEDDKRYAFVQSMGATEEDRQRVVAYVRKDGHVMQELQGDVAAVQQGTKRSWADTLLAAKSPHEAMKWLQEHEPDRFLLQGDRIRANLLTAIRPPEPPRYEKSSFIMDIGDISNLAVVLAGQSGTGKTQLAMAQGSSPKLIRTIDDLKSLDGSHSHLVFDDMDFGPSGLGWSGGNMIHLLDMEQTSSIKCRYADAQIPAGMPRLFTTNKPMVYPHGHIFPGGDCQAQLEGINRRYRTITISEKLFTTAD